MQTSRRAMLRRIGASSALAAGVGATGAQTASAQDLQKGAVIPEIDEFEGNYQGQWLEINDEAPAQGGDPVGGCDPAEWSEDQTQRYNGYLMDRRRGTEPIVEIPVLTEVLDPGPEPDTTYIVNAATECGNGYVFLDLKTVRVRSVVSEPAGPEADAGDGGGGDGGDNSVPGFGVGVAALGLGAAALSRLVGRDEQ